MDIWQILLLAIGAVTILSLFALYFAKPENRKTIAYSFFGVNVVLVLLDIYFLFTELNVNLKWFGVTFLVVVALSAFWSQFIKMDKPFMGGE